MFKVLAINGEPVEEATVNENTTAESNVPSTTEPGKPERKEHKTMKYVLLTTAGIAAGLIIADVVTGGAVRDAASIAWDNIRGNSETVADAADAAVSDVIDAVTDVVE